MVEGAAASAPRGAAARGDDPSGDGGVPKGWRPADLGELAVGEARMGINPILEKQLLDRKAGIKWLSCAAK